MTTPPPADAPPLPFPPANPAAPPAVPANWRRPLIRLALIPLFALAAGGLALLLLSCLAPEPLKPPDPVRAVEVLATYTHKRAVALSLLLVPCAALLAAGLAPWAAAALPSAAAQPAQAGRQTPAAAIALGWQSLAAVLTGLTLSLLLALWDLDHPTLSARAWQAIHLRLALLVTLGCLTVVWLQFAFERGLQLFRRLRRWDPALLARPAGLATVAALGCYGLGLSTTFLSRPWIAARVPGDALVAEHLARYTAAVAAEQGQKVVDQPTFPAEARLRVRSALRAALNAEAVNFTAETNPLLLATAVWWYHDDGPSDRRVDLRTGAISYYQWVGSDSRITLPDFYKAAGAASPPAGAHPTAGPGRGLDSSGGGRPASDNDRAGPLNGIAIRTGLIGTLAGYGNFDLAGLQLDKEDGAPLACLFAALAGLAALTANLAGALLERNPN